MGSWEIGCPCPQRPWEIGVVTMKSQVVSPGAAPRGMVWLLWCAPLKEEDESQLLFRKFSISEVPLPRWCDPEIPHIFSLSLEFPIIFLLSGMGVTGGLRNK